jgi:hypothetical protein
MPPPVPAHATPASGSPGAAASSRKRKASGAPTGSARPPNKVPKTPKRASLVGLFWNVQNCNPMSAEADGSKNGAIQNALLATHADLMIFCEAGDQTLNHAEIDTLRAALIRRSEGDTALPAVSPQLQSLLGYSHDPRSRRPHKFAQAKWSVAASESSMTRIGKFCNALDPDKFALSMRTAAAADGGRTSMISPLIQRYPYWEALDSEQQNRNYLVLSNRKFTLQQVEVEVKGAKRHIIRIEIDGRAIYAVHAPAFAKGGRDTVLQLADLIRDDPLPALAVGDMNIDVEEFNIEVAENSGDPMFQSFVDEEVRTVTFEPGSRSTVYKRRLHRNKGTIDKTIPSTQSSGGTLDFGMTTDAMAVEVTPAIPPDAYTDHGALLFTATPM